MNVEIAVSLDPKNCMGSSTFEETGECPEEKQWFRTWLENRLGRPSLVVLGKKTEAAMDAYGRRLRGLYPESRWVVLSRKGPGLVQILSEGHHAGFSAALILGGLGVFQEALALGSVDRIWIARLLQHRKGDLFFPVQYLDEFRLISREEKGTFILEMYDKL